MLCAVEAGKFSADSLHKRDRDRVLTLTRACAITPEEWRGGGRQDIHAAAVNAARSSTRVMLGWCLSGGVGGEPSIVTGAAWQDADRSHVALMLVLGTL